MSALPFGRPRAASCSLPRSGAASPGKRCCRGFTLPEVMVTVLIVGVLVAIALPSYRGYVLRGNRAAGKAQLQEITARQENYFGEYKSYATTLAALGYAGDPLYVGGDGSQSDTDSTNAVYRVSLQSATSLSYTAQALPIHQQTGDSACATLSLTNTGVRGASGSSGATECWSK